MSETIYSDVFMLIWIESNVETRIKIAFTCKKYLGIFITMNGMNMNGMNTKGCNDFQKLDLYTRYWRKDYGCKLCLRTMNWEETMIYDKCIYIDKKYKKEGSRSVLLCRDHFNSECSLWNSHEKSLILNSYLGALDCITCCGNPFVDEVVIYGSYILYKCDRCNDCISIYNEKQEIRKEYIEAVNECNGLILGEQMKWICETCLVEKKICYTCYKENSSIDDYNICSRCDFQICLNCTEWTTNSEDSNDSTVYCINCH